ncbi:uncharacterized protein EKO05_0009351 [Ascochyta rabiei]|nr:uncharacterized protein EKO05_0009351 [Ascochyta rabiei]UPX19075.1 hypothetical protein EKO05_0009351 [Ascochyta rabiei]
MKRSRSSYEALSPRSGDYHTQQHPATEQHCASSSRDDVYTEFFEKELTSVEHLDPLQQYLDSYDGHQEQANTSNQSGLASIGVDTQRSHLQTQQGFGRTQQSASQHDDSLLRGAITHDEHPGPISVNRERNTQQCFSTDTAASPYNAPHSSYTITRHRPTVTPMTNFPATSTESSGHRFTSYGPYCSLFLNSDLARSHRHMSTRFGRQPYVLPEEDPSIKEVEEDRQYQVGRIYDAMTRGDRAQDNTHSIAMKRWVNAAHYKSDLVEAFAHKLFDCLLVQVKEGFRGWHHNDYVDDDRKGEKEDRDADCMSRLENIIDALEREKTICEDVVNSASQIRMFVNAPIAYAARKYQNRVGNSKRGKTKAVVDLNPRPKKARRIGTRQTRARSGANSEVPTSRDSTPQFHTPATTNRPYYTTQPSQQLASSPMPNYPTSRQPLHMSAAIKPQIHAGRQQDAVTSPPMLAKPATSSSMSRSAMSPPGLPTSRLHNTQVTAKPPAQMSPLASTPSLSYSYHSAHPSPDDVKYPMPANSPASWPNLNFDNPLCTSIDPSLGTDDLLFSNQLWSNGAACANTGNAVSFDQNPNVRRVNLANLEHQPLQTATGASSDRPTDFESFWDDQPGVQPFSFDCSQEANHGYR